MAAARLDARGRDYSDRGDTLIELLVAVLIIGLASVALIGAVLTTTQTSVTHRNNSTLDAVLRSFADGARYQVENQPFDGSGSTSSQPQFQPCATSASSYYILSAPYPSTGPASTASLKTLVTVFAIGSSSADTVKLGSTTLTAGNSAISWNSSSNYWSFYIPTGIANGTYPLTFTSAIGTTYTSPTSFTVNSSIANSGGSSQFTYYRLTANLERMNAAGTGFDTAGSPPTTCTATSNPNVQQLTFDLYDSQPNSAADASENIALSNLGPDTLATITPSPSSAIVIGLGSSQTLQATFTLPTGSPTPTGTVSWSGLPVGSVCPQMTVTASPWTASCTLTTPIAGSYSPTATYAPGATSNISPAQQKFSVTVSAGTALVAVTSSPVSGSTVALGTTITFTATVTGVVGFSPAGTITWSGLPGTTACSGGNAVAVSGGMANCTVNAAMVAGNYNPTATYADTSGNYNSGATGNQATVKENTATPTAAFATPPGVVSGTNLTFTVNVNYPTQAFPPSGNPTWTITPSSGTATCTPGGPTGSGGTATYTCVVSGVTNSKTYTAKFKMASDTNYAAVAQITSSAVRG